MRFPCLLSLACGLATLPVASAITIQISYDYDTNNFFNASTTDGAAARATLEKAAERFSEIITTSLDEVPAGSSSGGTTDWRVSFVHPGTGSTVELSTAANAASDDIVAAGGGVASVYDSSFSIAADTWILYAGGRSMAVAGEGGTGTGTNFTSAFTDGSSHLRRNWRSGGYDSSDLPVWGGAITFDNDGTTDWHYEYATSAPLGKTDFYSIALHEIGHALGLSSSWGEFSDLIDGSNEFTGMMTMMAYNADNGTAEKGLRVVSATNEHFEEGTYDSKPFDDGSDPAPGTDPDALQDLLLEPNASFGLSKRRFEITNAEVGALKDIGWQVIPEPSSMLLLLLGVPCLLGRRRSN